MSEIFSHFKKNSAKYCHKYENFFKKSTRFYSQSFNGNRIFSTDFRKKKPEYQVQLKSIEWELSCFVRTDRRI